MITGDQAIALLIEANPVPDISTLDLSGEPLTTHLADLDPRGSEMTTTEPDISDLRPASGPRRLAGIAAGVAAVVVAGVFLFQTTDDSPGVDQPTTPVEVATGFVEAWTSFDADAAAAYLAPAALAEFGETLEAMRLRAQMNQAQGVNWSLGACEGTLIRNEVLVCPYEFHGLGSDLIGLGPYHGSFRITVLDDAIVEVLDRLTSRNPYAEQVVEVFTDWVKRTHPEDVPRMWSDSAQTNAALSEESIELWEQHRREWAETAEPIVSLAYPPNNHGGMPPEGANPSSPRVGEVVADLGLFHEGWAFVYTDGRAIWYNEGGLDIVELQLTPEGLDLVRSGALPLETLISRDYLPERAVEDPQIKLFVPSTYAVCGFARDAGPAGAEYAASQNVDLLPDSAQTLLAGKEQTITTRIPFQTFGLSYSDCHELSLADARAFLEVLGAEETVEVMPNAMRTDPYSIVMSWNRIDFAFHPILPHGQVMNFPG